MKYPPSPSLQSSDEEDYLSQYQKGSVLNPSTATGGQNEKDIAKPFQKIEVKTNTRGQIEKEKEQPTNQKNQIWDEEEIQNIPYLKQDQRQRPHFEVQIKVIKCNLKQTVGTEDIFLGINGNNPTSNCCQEVSIKVFLNDTKYSEI